MNIAQEIFIKYVRTKMMFNLRYRNESDFLQPVHIAASEITDRFFPYPKYDRNKEIKKLHDAGELRITQRGRAYYYEALKPGGYDLNLLCYAPIPQDNVTQTMLSNIKKVSLPLNASSTPYFDLFLKYKDVKPDLFFKVDEFCGRVHTPISNFHRTHRPYLLLGKAATTSLDVVTMQPLLLGKILYNKIGQNEYSTWINEGRDIYIELQKKASLNNRDDAKKKFFEILFSKPNEALTQLFGASEWINWINNYKHLEEPLNPHSSDKPHSNLAWLLQSTEVAIMRQVWEGLVNIGIPFISVHDEIIINEFNYNKAKTVLEDILGKEFTYFRLNTKNHYVADQVVASDLPNCLESQHKTEHFEALPAETVLKYPEKKLTPLWDITELETFLNNLSAPESPFKINQFGTINDPKQFIESHLEIVKSNNGNKTFAPYYNRLIELREALKA